MSKKGYKYANPRSPIIKFVRLPTRTTTEVATAVADVRCKLDTNLVGIELAVELAYDRQYLRGHRDAVLQFARQNSQYASGGQ